MKKPKPLSGIRCSDGEVYKFNKGVAVIPGFKLGHKPVKITYSQFRQIMQEIEDDVKKGKDHSIGGSRSSCVGACCSHDIKGN